MLDLSIDAEPDVNGCLNWLGAVTTAPITWDPKAEERVNVRQLLWEQAHGPLPEGAELGCCCQNPRCVELTHMDELVDPDAPELVEVQAVQGQEKPLLPPAPLPPAVPTLTIKDIQDELNALKAQIAKAEASKPPKAIKPPRRAYTHYPPLKTLADLKARCKVTEDGCWLFPGCRSGGGHGLFAKITTFLNGERKQWNVHRLAWVLAKGPTPRSTWVRHSCEHPECANPDHMYARAKKSAAQ